VLFTAVSSLQVRNRPLIGSTGVLGRPLPPCGFGQQAIVDLLVDQIQHGPTVRQNP
jgi:hypothetical protein